MHTHVRRFEGEPELNGKFSNPFLQLAIVLLKHPTQLNGATSTLSFHVMQKWVPYVNRAAPVQVASHTLEIIQTVC